MARASQFQKGIRHAWSDWRRFCRAWLRSTPGTIAQPREIPVIVSLTTIAERLPRIPFAIEGLLRQTSPPDRLILWLDEKLADRIPPLLRRQLRRGLEIRLIEDTGPHTKIIPALEEFQECRIVTADDDALYPQFWLAELLAAHEREPQSVTCHRAHRMVLDQTGKLLPYRQWDRMSPGDAGPSLWLFPTGVGGVLYPPNALHPEVCNRDVFRKTCPTADDVWLKAMSLLNNVPCQKVRPLSTDWPCLRGTQHKRLFTQNSTRGQNDIQLQAVFEHYDLYSQLKREAAEAGISCV